MKDRVVADNDRYIQSCSDGIYSVSSVQLLTIRLEGLVYAGWRHCTRSDSFT